MKPKYKGKFMLISSQPIEEEKVLKVEHHLNHKVALDIWKRFKIGVRFHVKDESEILISEEVGE